MDQFRIGIVSGKLGDVDGVSLEVDKWIDIFQEMGHEIFTIAGKYGSSLEHVPIENQLLLESIRFGSDMQRIWESSFFPHIGRKALVVKERRNTALTEEMMVQGDIVAAELFEMIQEYNIDVIIAENTNAMPMTLVGGVAIYKLATEKRVATIFHHHDFWWERSRFSANRIETLLNRIMPPTDLGVEHIVISSYAAHILRSIKRVHPKVIPNCEDFSKAPVLDDYNKQFRTELGFKEDDLIILQPTRIVPRKRIEDSISFVGKLKKEFPDIAPRLHYVISLYQGDELDSAYVDEIKELAQEWEVPLHLISDRVASIRRDDDQGRPMFTNRDVLVNADLVTYLPIWEGFGNALLEAVAAKVPVVVTTYLVYKTDIHGTGFRNIEVRDEYDENGHLKIPHKALEEAYYYLTHPEEAKKMVEHNFKVGREEFGYKKLRQTLSDALMEYGDEIKASRKRILKSKKGYSV